MNQTLKYTICFCKYKNKILMVYRIKPPVQNLWNGLGGKVNVGETYEEANKREVLEESGIDLSKAEKLSFGGVVTWKSITKDEIYENGMYTFIAEFNNPNILFDPIETREGRLDWKDINWVLDLNNKETVDNIPYFLPPMLKGENPKNYHFLYQDNKLVSSKILEI